MIVPARLALPRGCLLRMRARGWGAGRSPTLAPSGCVETGRYRPRGQRRASTGKVGPGRGSGPARPPTGLLRTQPEPFRGGRPGLRFISAVCACACECACARSSRSGSSSDKARSAAGPGVRGVLGRGAAGRGRAQEAEAGADQRGRAEPAGPTVTGPLTSSPFPSPTALPFAPS